MTKKFRDLKDIEEDIANRKREKFREDVSEDITKVWKNIFKEPPKKKKSLFWGFFKWIGILFLGLFIINFILGNVWLLRELIKSLFLS